jgi:hypothetical protein
MKKIALGLAVALVMGLVPSVQAGDTGKAFGDAHFIAYEGSFKNWPTGDKAQVIKDHEVPIYVGLPDKKYRVLGRIYDPRRTGIGVVGRAFAEGLFSENDRQRDCANQAKYREADAVLVTKDERVIKALGLDTAEIEKTAPLFAHKDKLVLAIKFQ